MLCESMARTLRVGSSGSDVEQWQLFLVGQGYNPGEADGSFGGKTKTATEEFQRDQGIDVDGAVGQGTLASAILAGFSVEESLPESEDNPSSSSWPPKPDFGPLSLAEREALFGKFAFKATPTAENPEGLTITDNWPSKNISTVLIPQLQGVRGAPSSGKIQFHTKAVPQLVALWAAWEEAGLLPLVQSWAGSWAPRFIRGSRTYLSNHATGTAFDINAQWNALGTVPALVGQKGSVRSLVQLANEHGFFWGGHFGSTRSDGMHFEVAFLK